MAEFESFDSKGNPKNRKDKKGNRIWIFWVAVIVLLFVVKACMVVTYDNQFKLIRRFGKVERVISVPGISFKIPFIETVDIVPDEILLYDLPASDVITSDKKTMIVDSYVLWRVTDPLKFAQTLGGSITNAENRIDNLVYRRSVYHFFFRYLASSEPLARRPLAKLWAFIWAPSFEAWV